MQFSITIIFAKDELLTLLIDNELSKFVIGIPVVLLIVKAVHNVGKLIQEHSGNLQKQFGKYFKTPDYQENLGFRHEIETTFRTLREAWLKPDERLLIVIDDLDRCSEKSILQIIEALQLFLCVNEVIVLLGVDQKIISNTLSHNYAHLLSKEAPPCEKKKIGYEYLEKFIQLPFYIPKTDKYDQYIEELVGEIIEEQNISEENENEVTHVPENQGTPVETRNEVIPVLENQGTPAETRNEVIPVPENQGTPAEIRNEVIPVPENQELLPVKLRKEDLEVIKKVINDIKPTPRYVKILINKTKLSASIISSDRQFTRIKLTSVIIWLGFCHKWPDYISTLLKEVVDPDNFRKKLSEIVDNTIIPPTEKDEIKQYFERNGGLKASDVKGIRSITNCFYYDFCEKCSSNCEKKQTTQNSSPSS